MKLISPINQDKINPKLASNHSLSKLAAVWKSFYNNRTGMEDLSHRPCHFSNKQLAVVSKYRQRLRQIQQQQITEKIVSKDTNNMDFYRITPKQQLPKYLQKMRFQTLHIKQKQIASTIKLFTKENHKPQQRQVRRKLKDQGHIMLLSEIYQHLGEDCPNKRSSSHAEARNVESNSQLQQWQKLRKEEKFQLTKMFKRHKPVEMRASQLSDSKDEVCRKQIDTTICKQLKDGSDYKSEIERALEIIEMTHSSESNMLNRYMLVENSSKLLKKELDDRKFQVEATIRAKMKLLVDARTQYHRLFEERNRLQQEQTTIKDQLIKDDTNRSLSLKKQLSTQQNEAKIAKTKRTIQALQQVASNLQQQLQKITLAETVYFKMSLRSGNDVRECGLVWVIKLLRITEKEIDHYEYPPFLDRRSRLFLVQKAALEEEERSLLEEKRKFVNLIGKSTSTAEFKCSRRSIVLPKETTNDRIVQSQFNEQVPKKYRRSLKKITQLNEQFIKNSALMEVREKDKSRGVQISGELQGLTNKQIYTQIGERIKKLDLSKMRKEKGTGKNTQLLQYQNLLESIKAIHIKLEDMDLQHENHLLNHYRDNKNLYFMQAAACFGYKRAYSMIIKHFSWKNYHDTSK